jgi:hypothetical protein
MSDELWNWLRSATLGGLAIVLLCVLCEQLWGDLRRRRRLRRSARGEREAPQVLRQAGYRVVDAQVERALEVEIDGEACSYRVRVDYLVRDRWRRVFVAEVKTGAVASDPLHRPTRRQLLEYQVGFPETAGVLLVDMEARCVRRIRFQLS